MKKKKAAEKTQPAAVAAVLTQATTPGELKSIPHGLIRPDPDQPRKTFDEAKLNELAESIRTQGVLQPLVVTHSPPLYRILEPELHDKQYRVEELKDGHWYRAFAHDDRDVCVNWAGTLNLEESYQIVFGERRWRAAGIAGLAEVPCLVRPALTEKDKFVLQFIENHARENLSAIEEAEAMAAQLAKRRESDAKFSAEDLAAELGLGRATVYERLKLTRLHPPVRAALLAGKIEVSVAGEIAKIPDPKAQEELLKAITNEQSWEFPFSVRDVQEMIEDDFVRQLSEAPFDQRDAGLHQEAGTCAACPHRSGNMVEQFPELKARPNVCTRPDCFAAKCKAHYAAEAEKITGKGGLVLTEKEFKKVKADYVDADREGWGLFADEYTAPAKALGKHAPAPVVVATPEGLKKYFAKSDLPEAAKKAKVKLADHLKRSVTVATETPEEKEKREAKQAAAEALNLRRREWWKNSAKRLAEAVNKVKDAVAWELLGGKVEINSWEEMHAKMHKLAKTDRARAIMDHLSNHGVLDDCARSEGWDEDGLAVWKKLGFDIEAEFAESEAEHAKAAQPEMAMPPKKKEVKQGKLLDTKPHKKKKAKK